ncbi:rhodanese domain-containing protein CG4456-like isoform X2 [Agrilus planipennis]|uniref:Rhodanese domain-containing protein CG4456-like isoform X2 n=1 Tax=Agrilus planipennis TaxID=224129 RepID=A0A1W4XD13_AGRPL|nr:rhodanese domain-containing protein CG4456-like isoform X2 [Agrilus planipennis]
MSRYTINIFKNYFSARYEVPRKRIQTTGFFRNVSGEQGIATFKEVKEATNNPNIIVIDVREPSELKQTGVIPGSINIPCNRAGKATEQIRGLGYKKRMARMGGKKWEITNNRCSKDSLVNKVEDAFKSLKDDEFQKVYGLPKPTTDSSIIFSCLLGKRSQIALETIQKLGFKKVRNFKGGWQEWEAKTNKI